MSISTTTRNMRCACPVLHAGAAPSWLLPVTLDVGTDNETLRTDPLYLGTPTTRVRGPRLEALVLELAEALQVRFRRRVLCHFEDFAASSAFQLLQVCVKQQQQQQQQGSNVSGIWRTHAMHTVAVPVSCNVRSCADALASSCRQRARWAVVCRHSMMILKRLEQLH